MILIPFFWDTRGADWIRFGVFLCSGGREVWSVDDTDTESDIREMLLENGFPVDELIQINTVIYARIRYADLKLSSFYLWNQVDPAKSEEDVWRLFQIPKGMWSCQVFKEKFWKISKLPVQFDVTLN
jgi:hypothetical protein